MKDVNGILDSIPPSRIHEYGKTEDEIIANYTSEHPEVLIDIEDIDSLLDYIVITLCQSVCQEVYALKGGYPLSRLTSEARSTKDIDMAIPQKEIFLTLEKVFKSIGLMLVSHGASEFQIRNPIDGRSGGLDIYRVVSKQVKKKVVSIDVSVSPLDYGIVLQDRLYTRFSVERMLCDKIGVTFSTKRYRRVKDLYDIYIILRNFDIRMDELKLCLTNKGVELSEENSPFNQDVIIEWKRAWNKLELDRGNRMVVPINKPEFNSVLNIYGAFMTSVVGKDWSGKTWIHNRSCWRDSK